MFEAAGRDTSSIFCSLSCAPQPSLLPTDRLQHLNWVQVMEPAAGQLAAAVISLMSSLTARHHESPGLLSMVLPQLSFARWGLEGEHLLLALIWLSMRASQAHSRHAGRDMTAWPVRLSPPCQATSTVRAMP